MKFFLSIFILLSSSVVFAEPNIPLNGLDELKKVYQSLIKNPSPNIPLPSLFVIDTKTNVLLNYEEITSLLNKTNTSEKLDRLPKYLTHKLSVDKVKTIPQVLSSNKRYLVLYCNPEPHLVQMMEKMLKININADLKVISNKIAQLDALILYNKKGVYSDMFI